PCCYREVGSAAGVAKGRRARRGPHDADRDDRLATKCRPSERRSLVGADDGALNGVAALLARAGASWPDRIGVQETASGAALTWAELDRSEEHTSELQSP